MDGIDKRPEVGDITVVCGQQVHLGWDVKNGKRI